MHEPCCRRKRLVDICPTVRRLELVFCEKEAFDAMRQQIYILNDNVITSNLAPTYFLNHHLSAGAHVSDIIVCHLPFSCIVRWSISLLRIPK